MSQQGFWDWEERHQKLSNKKPLLDRLNEIVPWEEFRSLLEQIHQKERKNNAGRKPLDVILMFKLLLLQKIYNISDEELEYQVNDQLSLMKFLGLGIEDTIPDATTVTVWSFLEQLMKHDLIRKLFDKFNSYLRREGYEAKEGQIVDATLGTVQIWPILGNKPGESEPPFGGLHIRSLSRIELRS